MKIKALNGALIASIRLGDKGMASLFLLGLSGMDLTQPQDGKMIRRIIAIETIHFGHVFSDLEKVAEGENLLLASNEDIPVKEMVRNW